MCPEKLGLQVCDLNGIKKIINKDTQTNDSTNKVEKCDNISNNSKLPLPRDLEKQHEGATKVLSFGRIIQDPCCPKSITIIRESVTEEVHPHSDPPNDETFSNRYRYCKEVIKPFLKDYPPDCPNSAELLIKDAILAANEEFPEFPPCYEVPDPCDTDKDKPPDEPDVTIVPSSEPEKPEVCDKEEKPLLKLCPGTTEPKICIEVKDKCPCGVIPKRKPPDDCLKPEPCKKKPSPCKETPPPCKEKPPPCEEKPPSCEEKPPCKKKPEYKMKDSEKPCPDATNKDLNCLSKIFDAFKTKTKEANTCTCINSKPIVTSPPVEPSPSVKSNNDIGNRHSGRDRAQACQACESSETMKAFMKAHDETMAILKVAMEDFMCKAFRSTEDAITLISTESARKFENLKKSLSDTDCKPPKKCNASSEEVRRSGLTNTENVSKDKTPPWLPGCNKSSDSSLQYLEKLVNKKDSTLSMISTLTINLPRPPKPPLSFNDTSSKHDIPNTPITPPKDIENVMNAAGTFSMFTTIKEKLWAIFVEDDNSEKVSKCSSSASSDSSDENLINKMID